MSITENNFTTHQTELCPHPEYWHAPDSEATEEEVSEFIGALVRMLQPEFVLETGAYMGDTTLEISRALYMNGHGKGVSVEWHKEYADEASRRLTNLMGINNKMQILHMSSAKFEPSEPIDFAFFDADMQDRASDFKRLHSQGHFKKYSIVAFHDTAPHHKVRDTLIPLEQEGLLTIIWFNTPRGLALGQVL